MQFTSAHVAHLSKKNHVGLARLHQTKLMSRVAEQEEWDIVIKPKIGFFELNLKQVFSYLDLLILFVKRDLVVVYKQTILGPTWFFLQPIMTMLIFIFVFGRIANISTDGIPRPLFYLSGIVMWNFFAECFTKTSNIFVANAAVFGKVYFPRIITPFSIIISNGIKFAIQFGLFLAMYFYFVATGANVHATWHLALFPVLLLMMATLGLGFGLIFSSLTTKYKDLTFLIQFGVQLLMYATPVIYPLSSIPDRYKFYMLANPISSIMETFKLSFLGEGTFSIGGLIYSAVFAVIVLLFGILIFNRTEKSFMDTV